jgi:cell pole-organizing protein PopZ
MSNASTPPPASPDGADPSMEEILASIRRILNDDDVPPTPAAEEPAAEEDDVLILDDTMIVAAAESPSDVFEAEGAEPVSFQEPAVIDDDDFHPPPRSAPDLQPPRQEAEERPIILPSGPMEQPELTPDLLGPEAAAAAASSVGTLVRTLAAGRATQVYAGGPTLEDMVRAELRPMLKGWLDMHLPPMVERLVRAEIERVVGRFVP